MAAHHTSPWVQYTKTFGTVHVPNLCDSGTFSVQLFFLVCQPMHCLALLIFY